MSKDKDKDNLDILIENMIKNDLLSLKSYFRDMYDGEKFILIDGAS